MKKLMMAVAAAIVLAVSAANAASEKVNGITWEYRVVNGVAVVERNVGAGGCIPTSTSGVVSIPETLGGYPVKVIGTWAFQDCSLVTEFVIGSNITNICSAAFWECTGLKRVRIPGSVELLEGSTYSFCSNIKDIEIGEGVAIIDDAFSSCSPTNVVLPSTLIGLSPRAFGRVTGDLHVGSLRDWCEMDILEYAEDDPMPEQERGFQNPMQYAQNVYFNGAKLPERLEFPDGIDTVTSHRLYDKGLVKELVFPSSVSTLESYAFNDFSELTHIVLGVNMTNIAINAMGSLPKLRTVTIPAGYPLCKELGRMLVGTTNRIDFVLSAGGANYSIRDGGLYSADGRVLIWANNRNVSSFVIPSSVKEIGDCALGSCTGLQTLTLPDGIVEIGAYAFQGSRISSVVIPDSVVKIGDYAFSGCRSLKTVTMSKKIKEIGASAFSSCPFSSIELPSTLQFMGAGIFANTSLRSVAIPAGVREIPDSAFRQCSSLTNVVLTENVERIGATAFYYCSGIKDMQLPTGLTQVGSSAFYRVGIKDVVFESSVEIGSSAFEYNSSLTNVTFAGEAKIGDRAFESCSSLASVKFAGDVEIPGRWAFWDCTSLKTLIFNGDADISGSWVFWDCTSIQEVVFNGYAGIGNHAFWDCTRLQKVVFNDDAKVSTFAFEGSPVKWWVLPSGVSIPSSGVPTTSGVTLEMQYGSTTFDTVFLANCSWLKTKVGTLVVPATVTTMQLAAIRQLTNLTKIIFKGAKPSILDAETIDYLRTSGIEMETQEAGPAPVREWKVRTQTVDGLTWTYQTDGYSARLGDGESCCVRGTAGTSVIHVPETLGGIPVLEITPNAFGWGFAVPGVDTIVFDKYVELPSQTFVGTNSIRRVEFGAMSTLASDAFMSSLVESVAFRGDVVLENDSFGIWSNVRELEIGPSAAVGSAFANPLALALRSGTTSFDTSYLAESPSLKAKVETLVLPASVKSVEKAALQELPNLKKIVFDGCDPKMLDAETRAYLKSQNLEGEYRVGGVVQEWPNLNDEGGGEGPIVDPSEADFEGPWTNATVTIKGVTWTYQTNGRAVRLGNGNSACISTSLAGKVEIPDRIIGLPVIWLNDYAFENCTAISALSMGGNVRRIGHWAFWDCGGSTNLTSLTLSPTLEFLNCRAFQYFRSRLENLYVGDLKTWLEMEFVSDSSGLLCNPMERAKNVYYNGEKFPERLVIPEGITNITSYRLYDQGLVRELVLPTSLRTIEDHAFNGFTALTNVIFGSQAVDISPTAFDAASKLETITFPVDYPVTATTSGVRAWNPKAKIVVDGNPSCAWRAEGLFSADGTVLISAALPDSATSYVIPATVKEISPYAFYGLKELLSVTIPDSVVSIGASAFAGCTKLGPVSLPASLVRLGGNAFPANAAPEHVVLPDTLREMWGVNLPFDGHLSHLTIPDSVGLIGDFPPSEILARERDAEVVRLRMSVNSGLLTNLVIGAGVTNCDVSLFNCPALESVTIRSSAIYLTINGNTINKLRRLELPGLTQAFYHNPRPLELALSEGTLAFDSQYLSKASSLRSMVETLVIPASVTTVQLAALKQLTNLKRIIYKGRDLSLLSEASIQSYLTEKGVEVVNDEHYGKPGEGESGGGEDKPTGWEELLDRYPSVKVIETKPREGDPTVLEVTFAVSNTAETVSLRALAFENGERSFAKVLRMVTFLEGTGDFLGDAVTPNRTYTLAWKVSEDWHVDLSKVSVEVMMFDGGLLPLRLATIPATAKRRKMTVTNNAITSAKLMDALYWLYAGGDAELVLENGVLMADGKTLAEGETPTADGAAFVLGKMGFGLLMGDELDYVNRLTRFGLVPNGPRQYGVRYPED